MRIWEEIKGCVINARLRKATWTAPTHTHTHSNAAVRPSVSVTCAWGEHLLLWWLLRKGVLQMEPTSRSDVALESGCFAHVRWWWLLHFMWGSLDQRANCTKAARITSGRLQCLFMFKHPQDKESCDFWIYLEVPGLSSQQVSADLIIIDIV